MMVSMAASPERRVGGIQWPLRWLVQQDRGGGAEAAMADFKSLNPTNKPPRGKTNNVVSEQVRHKPACTSTGKS